MRKIVSIAFEPDSITTELVDDQGETAQCISSIEYAICDDGTVWKWEARVAKPTDARYPLGGGWVLQKRFNDIPQD